MRKKLKDVCMFYSGTGFPIQYQGQTKGEYPFYKVGDIANNAIAGKIYLELCNNYISSDVAKMIKGCILPKDTVVFAKIGEALKLNRRAITSCDCLIDNNAMGIAPKSDSLRIQYFYFCMKNLKMQTLAESTTVPSVRKTVLQKYEIEVPSLVEQEEIEKKLTLTQKIIENRRQELSYLDEIIKARFVELFGLPVSNTKGWKTEQMGEVAPAINYKGEFDDEVWLLNLDMVEAQTGRILDYLVVSEEEVGNSTCTFDTSNVLYSKLRPYLNKVVIPDRCGYATSELVPLQPVKTKINREYLAFMLRSDEFVNMINEKVAGAKMPRVPMGDFRKFDVPVPPMELQEQFADFVKQVDKSKFDTMTFAPIYAIINLYLHAHFYQGRR